MSSLPGCFTMRRGTCVCRLDLSSPPRRSPVPRTRRLRPTRIHFCRLCIFCRFCRSKTHVSTGLFLPGGSRRGCISGPPRRLEAPGRRLVAPPHLRGRRGWGAGRGGRASLRPSPVASGLPLALAPPSSTFRDPLDSVGPPGTSGQSLCLEVCDLVTPAQCAWAMRGDSHRFWVRMGARLEASPERGPVGFFNPKSQPNHPGSWQIHNITAGLCANQLF